jgi:endonuclease I
MMRLEKLQAKHRDRLYFYFRRKCIEPVKRKHGSTGSEWQIHRFEIKGGISIRDAMIYDMVHQRNPFLDLIKEAA